MLLVIKSVHYHKKQKKKEQLSIFKKIMVLFFYLKAETLSMLENICTNNFDFHEHFIVQVSITFDGPIP